MDPDMLPLLRICESLILFGFQQPAARFSGVWQVLSVVFVLNLWVLEGTEPFSVCNKVRHIFVF